MVTERQSIYMWFSYKINNILMYMYTALIKLQMIIEDCITGNDHWSCMIDFICKNSGVIDAVQTIV